MKELDKKIDFAVILSVNHANPNGDPLNGNRPRIDNEGYGEISDVCIKRKIRNRLLDAGNKIFVQSDDNNVDSMPTLKARAIACLGEDAFTFGAAKKKGKGKSKKDSVAAEKTTGASVDNVPENIFTKKENTAKAACAKWLDVRSFGQLFAFKSEKNESASTKEDDNAPDDNNKGKDEIDGDGVSIAIRGPVSIQSAFSVEPVVVTSIQITKSVSGEGDGSKKASDTMGMKHRIDHGIYVSYGSINPQLAKRTGFSYEDAQEIKKVLPKLFENDASSARPEGSMEVKKVIWWEHNCENGQYSSARVHRSLTVHSDGKYSINWEAIKGLDTQEIEGQ
jgi:CRISPR-associated protein Csd2